MATRYPSIDRLFGDSPEAKILKNMALEPVTTIKILSRVAVLPTSVVKGTVKKLVKFGILREFGNRNEMKTWDEKFEPQTLYGYLSLWENFFL